MTDNGTLLEAWRRELTPKKVTVEDIVLDESDGKGHTLVFKSIGRKAWSDLIAEHPPTDDQREQGLNFDPEPFTPHAIAACCCEVDGEEREIPLEFAQWMSDNLNSEDVVRLYSACLEANELGRKLPKARSAARPRSRKK